MCTFPNELNKKKANVSESVIVIREIQLHIYYIVQYNVKF